MSADTWQWIAIGGIAAYFALTDWLNWRAIMALADVVFRRRARTGREP